MNIMVNGQAQRVPDGWENETLLAVLRDGLGLVGSKYGCGVGLCGACAVLIDGEATRSCVLPVASVGDRRVTTIEGLADGDRLHPLQQAWLDERVPQCGYCQSGQIIAAHALLIRHPRPDDAQITAALDGQLCRCGTQQRICAAVKRAAAVAASAKGVA